MAKTKKRASASRKSSKRGKQKAKASRKTVAKRAASKKTKSKVRRAAVRAAKPRAEKESPPQIAAAIEALRQVTAMPLETTITNMIEEPQPRRVVVAEHEPGAPAAPTTGGAESEREDFGPEAKPEAA